MRFPVTAHGAMEKDNTVAVVNVYSQAMHATAKHTAETFFGTERRDDTVKKSVISYEVHVKYILAQRTTPLNHRDRLSSANSLRALPQHGAPQPSDETLRPPLVPPCPR